MTQSGILSSNFDGKILNIGSPCTGRRIFGEAGLIPRETTGNRSTTAIRHLRTLGLILLGTQIFKI
nr:MAG TPA: hypothetical protein [Caudoviricetes sp.]